MAEKYNMKLLFKVPFADYFQQKIHNSENRGLIGRMQGLEVGPPVRSYIRGEVGARTPNLSAEAYWPNARIPEGKANDECCVRVCVQRV